MGIHDATTTTRRRQEETKRTGGKESWSKTLRGVTTQSNNRFNKNARDDKQDKELAALKEPTPMMLLNF